MIVVPCCWTDVYSGWIIADSLLVGFTVGRRYRFFMEYSDTSVHGHRAFRLRSDAPLIRTRKVALTGLERLLLHGLALWTSKP